MVIMTQCQPAQYIFSGRFFSHVFTIASIEMRKILSQPRSFRLFCCLPSAPPPPSRARRSVSFLYTGLMLLAIVLKWTLIGRFKVGKYPLWGSFYYRWWIVTRVIDLLPTTFMRGTFMITWFYRMLGAKVCVRCVCVRANMRNDC